MISAVRAAMAAPGASGSFQEKSHSFLNRTEITSIRALRMPNQHIKSAYQIKSTLQSRNTVKNLSVFQGKDRLAMMKSGRNNTIRKNNKCFLGSIRASSSEDQLPSAQHSQYNLDDKVEKKYNAANLESVLERSTASMGGNRVCQSVDDERIQTIESWIERRIFDCRFFTLMAVVGSLAGSFLCFTKGCRIVFEAFKEYARSCWIGLGTGKVILLLVEAVDVYLIGTVMLIFGMGLYELFVSALEVPDEVCLINGETRPRAAVCGSNFFGLFRLRERPRWLEIHSLDELKTKLGHVIVMILLVGMFEKSKKVVVHSALDLLYLSMSILFSAGSLFLLSKLNYREIHRRG